MLPFIFYGSRASTLGAFHVDGLTCRRCKSTGTQAMVVAARYAHLYWIPLFPIGKTAVTECASCRHTVIKGDFTSRSRKAYREVSADMKGPTWHWSGAGIIALIALGVAISTATSGSSAAVRSPSADPREDYLAQDISMLSRDPSKDRPLDSTAAMLSVLMQMAVTDEMQPQDFAYATQTLGGKSLILMRVPTLDDLRRSEWPQIIAMVEDVVDLADSTSVGTRYIGILGTGDRVELVKTPHGTRTSDLLAYYDMD